MYMPAENRHELMHIQGSAEAVTVKRFCIHTMCHSDLLVRFLPLPQQLTRMVQYPVHSRHGRGGGRGGCGSCHPLALAPPPGFARWLALSSGCLGRLCRRLQGRCRTGSLLITTACILFLGCLGACALPLHAKSAEVLRQPLQA